MMNEPATAEQIARWGLCATCAHRVLVTTDRGSVFVQCALARTDPRFRKYPPLPVRACDGYKINSCKP
jgi:hypothetical protein